MTDFNSCNTAAGDSPVSGALCAEKEKPNQRILDIALQFQIEGEPVSAERYGCGHINETYLLIAGSGKRYILQKISPAFSIPELMKNIEAVTKFAAERADDPRGAMTLVRTKDDKSYFEDETGAYRVYNFIENSVCLQAPETPDDFYQSAVAFGGYEKLLSAFPAEELFEPIPNFHNTPDRYRIFKETIAADPCGRAASVQPEIDFALAREKEAGELQRMRDAGILPTRVTHNDTKLNNVMLDEKTHKGLCIIDLDTVMPGLSAYDFGDSIRFGAATAAEDEQDLDKMTIDLDLYRTYARGFIEACDLTEEELKALPLGAKIMTLECGVRFLTDHIDGDHYFSIHRENHNLDRARTQFKLVTEMEAHWDEMNSIIKEEAEKAAGKR